MNSTIRFYEENADELASRYEAVDFSDFVDKTLSKVRKGGRVLDVACGSGRDAAAMFRAGLDVVAADASRAMLDQAVALHPELRGRTRPADLVDGLPFEDREFDAVTSWATIMHVPPEQLERVFVEIHRVTKGSGIFAYSVNTRRPGLNDSGIDDKGRLFTCLPAADWERFHVAAGFATIDSEETEDITGRSGIRWVTFRTLKAVS